MKQRVVTVQQSWKFDSEDLVARNKEQTQEIPGLSQSEKIWYMQGKKRSKENVIPRVK